MEALRRVLAAALLMVPGPPVHADGAAVDTEELLTSAEREGQQGEIEPGGEEDGEEERWVGDLDTGGDGLAPPPMGEPRRVF